MAEEKRIIEISIKPQEIDYAKIFAATEVFDEWMKVLLNSYVAFLTSGKYDIAESFKEFINDLDLARNLYVTDEKEKASEVMDVIPEIPNAETIENID